MSIEDFFSEDATNNIEIAVTFTALMPNAKELFAHYVENDDLTVVRVFSDPQIGKSGSYHGTRLQNPDFLGVRKADGKKEKTKKYKELKENETYASLPVANSAEAALKALSDWESQNPEKCLREREEDQFFGFTGVGQGYLGRYTRFIHVPAVRDASEDAVEGRGSSVTEIMDLVVWSALAKREDVAEFRQQTRDQYKAIMNPEGLSELNDLERVLSNTLQSYVPGASVLLQWTDFSDIEIPMPQAQIKLREDDYASKVERTGHGLQRAFIVTMLQHLAAARTPKTSLENKTLEDGLKLPTVATEMPNLVLAIEEPELYQHPSRQRHLASVLLNLATGVILGVAQNTQVIYTTHSPLFVGLDRFDQIRVLRKITHSEGQPKATRVNKADMEKVANELWKAADSNVEKFTAATLRPRLLALMTPWMNEGFFADLVVLVEGEDDRAAILGTASAMNVDLDAQGITVIPCSGKTNLDRPFPIFRQLGIPVYVLWDGDYKTKNPKSEVNKCLLRLLGQSIKEWPDYISDSTACFKVELEETLEDEMGREFYRQSLAEAQQQLGMDRKGDALKNPVVFQHLMEKAAFVGKTSQSLRKIVEKIIVLKTQTENAA